jgi:hypothetical protein
MQWELKKYLLEFNSPVGRHTSKLISQDLLATMWKFRVEKKVHSFIYRFLLPTTEHLQLVGLDG